MTTIQKTLKKGISNTTLTNAQYATNTTIKQKEKELLQPLITDTGILNILLQEENMKKLAPRLIHTITYEGKTETGQREKLATSTTANKTLTTTINEIIQTMKEEGNEIGSGKKLKTALENKGHYINLENNNTGWVLNLTIKTKLIQT